MTRSELLQHINVDPRICGRKRCIQGTRIYIAVILDRLAEGLTPEQIIDHCPQLTLEDTHAALAYASELAQEGMWQVAV